MVYRPTKGRNDSMTIEKIPQIEGAYAIVRDRFEDVRGSFQELYNFDKMVAAETPLAVKQANQSISFFGTLRGLHIQANNPQGKLISVAYGQIFDVMVDLRQLLQYNGKIYLQGE